MTTTSFTKHGGPSRRRLLGMALAAGAVGATVPSALGARAAAAATPVGGAAAAGFQLAIPAPTGPYEVGTADLHLVDRGRPDPLRPDQKYPLMATVWYPARDAGRYPQARWMTPGVFQAWLGDVGFDPTGIAVPTVSASVGAPVHRGGRRLPVVVYSHGAHDHRADATTAVTQLASHGYVVVTVAHTYDAYTQFPGGPVLTPDFTDPVPMAPADFAADLRFVLDCVEDIAAGRNPDVDGRPLPDGLAHRLDLQRIGAFGWSKGGTAAALTAIADDRVRAGLSFDGPMQPTITTDLAKPFLMMAAEMTRSADPQAQEFWTRLTGWRRYLELDGAAHRSFTDTEGLILQAAPLLGLTPQQIQGFVGTMDPAEGVRIQQAYPLAFFDLHLKHRGGRLLDGPSPDFPAVRFVP